MKTQNLNIMKNLVNVVLISTLLTIVSCQQQKNKSVEEKTSKTENEVKAPKMDIHTASFMGDVATIKQHIAAGSDLNAKDQYGSTPLTIAATFGKTEAAIALIEGGADLSVKNNEGSTPLHVASFFCRKEIVKALLAKNADKNAKNNYGSTPLESVSGGFKDVKPIYEQLQQQLGPLGLKLDLSFIEKTRPEIAELLK